VKRQYFRPLWPLVVLLAVVAAACGGDDDGGDNAAPKADQVLRILVTNDDGVGGEGIDALVRGLETLDDVEVTVVAPADDRSGTGDSTSNPPPTASDATLIGGHEAIAVAGYPADSVIHALDQVLQERPHVVVSGVNKGQNLGPVVYASGTVGAARTAARRGIPALAVSQGLGDTIDYETGVRLALDWLEEHRKALLAGDVGTESIANLNVPSCATGEMRGEVDVASAEDSGTRNVLAPSDCNSSLEDPADDVEGFLNGYATLSEVDIDAPS
jgi:5'-nucleotidase